MKPAVFDLVLSLAIAAYIGAVYLAIKVKFYINMYPKQMFKGPSFT